MRYLQFCLRSFVATQRTLLTHNTLISLIQFPLSLYWAIYCDDITLSYTCKFHLEVSSCYSIHVLSACTVCATWGCNCHIRPFSDCFAPTPSQRLAFSSVAPPCGAVRSRVYPIWRGLGLWVGMVRVDEKLRQNCVLHRITRTTTLLLTRPIQTSSLWKNCKNGWSCSETSQAILTGSVNWCMFCIRFARWD